jgi:hypothetical protein
MKVHRTATPTHFGPLFLTALCGWMAFNLANSGTLSLLPGMIVAALLAYGGTIIALRLQASDDPRAAYPTAHIARHAPTRATPRGIITTPSGEPRYEMDIAAGD